MQIGWLSLGIYGLFLLNGYAHEPNEAFFAITQTKNTVEVLAEFPWTLRNALMEFNPLLENATHKEDFENTFVEYLTANLLLRDKGGNLLEYKGHEELENSGHSHQNQYRIRFQGKGLFEVTNTLMLNVYPDQKNHHILTLGPTKMAFKTQKEAPRFNLGEKRDTGYVYLFIVSPILIYLVQRLRFRKRAISQ